MEQITSIKELNDLILPYFKKGVLTNNFLKLEDYDIYIKENSLFFEKIGKNLFFFRNINGINNIYFYINEENKCVFPKNSVVEFLENNENITNFFYNNNFHKVKVRREMKLIDFSNLDEKTNPMIANEEELEKILDVITANFNGIYGCIPSIYELKKNKILVNRDRDGNIDGVVHFKNEKSVSNILHISVVEDKRGQGVGKGLLNSYVNYARKDCTEFRLWVNNDNYNAIEFYLKNGYSFTGRESIVMSNIIE